MITYRLRGLVNLHIVATAVTVTSYFLLVAVGVRYVPLVNLNPDVNLLSYAVAIFVGLLFSGRFWNHLGARFHVINWVDAAHIASRQIVVVALFVFALAVALKDLSISRLFLALFLLTAWVALIVLNRLLPATLARAAFHRAHQIPTLFVGSAVTVAKLNPWIHQKEHLGVKVAGILSDEPLETTSHTGPLLGATSQLADVLDARGIGQVILLEIPSEGAKLTKIVEECQQAGCRLLVYHNFLDRLAVKMTPVVEEQHLFFTAHEEPLEDPFNRAMKRVFDIVVSLPVVLFILPPLCLVVAVAQRIQAPGPLLFARPRGGQRAREFFMLKFRSMYAAAPDAKKEAQQARAGDNRIYPFGSFLRKTSLDEFPQFWNVLVGEMSVVGPRPHLPQHDTEFRAVAKTYRTRQLVKPGITGLAQVSGYRGEIRDPEMLQQRVQLDIEYITRWSVWLDAQITFRTLWQVFFPPKSAL